MGSSAGRWAPGPGWALRPDCQSDSVAELADKVQRLIGVFVSRYEPTSKLILIRGFEYVIQSVNTTHRWMQGAQQYTTPTRSHTKTKKKKHEIDIMVCVNARMQTHTFKAPRFAFVLFFSLYTYTSLHGLTQRNSFISGSLRPEASESCSRHWSNWLLTWRSSKSHFSNPFTASNLPLLK